MKIGIIARAREAAILTELSNSMFELEDAIVSVNIDNLKRGKLTSTETMYALSNRKYITINNNSIRLEDTDRIVGLVQNATLNNPKLPETIISFNGDVWVDNYKRGKLRLTDLQQTINGEKIITSKRDYLDKTSFTVINGTTDYDGISYACKISPISTRDDFIAWVDKYGNLVSVKPDINVFVPCFEDAEYIAVFGGENYIDGETDYSDIMINNLQDTAHRTYRILAELDENFVPTIFDTASVKSDEIIFDLQSYFFFNNEDMEKTVVSNNAGVLTYELKNRGVCLYDFSINFSDNPDNLIGGNDKFLAITYGIDNYYFANEEDDNYFIAREIASVDLDLIKESFGQDIKGIYYSVDVEGVTNDTYEGLDLSDDSYYWSNSMIKYISFEE